jgi:4-hydroxy-3-methylbut-2-enyl diphosphate reductase
MNRCTSFEADRYNEPNRAFFYEKNRGILVKASVVAGLVSLGLGVVLSFTVVVVLFIGSMLGAFYSLRMEPRALNVGKVLDFPASRTVVVTVGWVVSLALLPALANPELVGAAWPIAILFAFGMTLMRSGLMELRDIQGDQIVGKRTLPILLGKEQTEVMLACVCAAMAVMLVSGVVNGWVASSIGIAMLVPVIISGLGIWLYKKKIIGHSGLTEAVVDLQFISAGIVALIVA